MPLEKNFLLVTVPAVEHSNVAALLHTSHTLMCHGYLLFLTRFDCQLA
jgi:hypothetical protein